ncbi:fumarylacetoacetate hydrolase family protein [Proteobacteria bacterium 005FR1]|nr:fumarylacetoacetate hydrolase family protein [Proteobacteria bacterium 005FR1]
MACAEPTTYLRYQQGSEVAYGILEGDTIHQLKGELFENPVKTGRTVKLDEVKILTPVEPSKVIAVGLNYKSHLGETSPAQYPGLFTKFPTSLIADGENIVIPSDSTNIHYEGEMVVVIGKKAKDIAPEEVQNHIFGITIGNDVSERAWQRDDLQWFRAKASDTFGPIGPYIVSGLDYSDLLLETKVNGEIRQSSSTELLIFDVPTIVSYVSRYVTLLPGDVIYTGTPGVTRAFKEGDVIEVSLEGVGVLSNRAVKE